MLKLLKNRAILKSSALTFTSLAFAQGVSFIVFSILAKMVGAIAFGKFSIIYNSALLLSIVGAFGLNVVLTKLINDNLIKDEGAKVGRFIAFAYQLCFGIVFIFFTLSLMFQETWASVFSGSKELWEEVFIVNLFIAFYSLCTIQTGILLGFKNFSSFFYSNIVRGTTLLLVPVGYAIASLNGALVALGISSLLQALINHYYIIDNCKKKSIAIHIFQFQKKSTHRELLNLAVPFLLSSFFVYPITWLTNRMMVSYPLGYSELGVFAISFQIRTIITFIPSSLGNVILPIFSSHYVKNDLRKLESSLGKAMLSFSLVGLLISTIIVGSIGIITNYYASDIHITANLLYVTAATSFIMTVQMPYGFLVNAMGKMWAGFWLNLLWAVLLLGLAFYFIDGIDDAFELAVSYLIAYSAHALWTSAYVYYTLNQSRINEKL